MAEDQAQARRFEIFRGADAPTLDECGCMRAEGETPNLFAVLPKIMQAGMVRGEHAEVPYRRPGMSLARLRLKSGFPLPLHTHDCDCLYYIVAGSIQLGSETLEAGDGFFVGSEVPYGYTAGPEGAEVIEFRAADSFNIRIRDKPVSAWEKDAERILAAQERWASEPLPGR